MIRVVLPVHLRNLARTSDEVQLEIAEPATITSLLNALEERYPVLRGTIRDQLTGKRRPLVRFFTCGEDVSHEPPDSPLPAAVARGAEPFCIFGALAAGQALLRTQRSAERGVGTQVGSGLSPVL